MNKNSSAEDNFYNYEEEDFSNEKIEQMKAISGRYAHFKGLSVALESQRRALRSKLMKEAEARGVTSVQKQERDAEADFRYHQVLEAVRVAKEEESRAWMEYDIIKIEFERWRTRRSDYRASMNMR